MLHVDKALWNDYEISGEQTYGGKGKSDKYRKK